ncbi:hypothetical protein [Vibrio genomosp. F10]|uniref:hypothetical protein n=1 Tax=Vibrio genomosp. F10 TaxID=723171 RepID=UPI00035D3CE1|nr:hypothetical protein [Vibrio genomosp. F10]OEF09521.1 hypothetical protein A1QI_13810 [Vibrio genomosp. F10 str. 9ZB36]
MDDLLEIVEALAQQRIRLIETYRTIKHYLDFGYCSIMEIKEDFKELVFVTDNVIQDICSNNKLNLNDFIELTNHQHDTIKIVINELS